MAMRSRAPAPPELAQQDKEAVDRILAGDRGSFEEFFDDLVPKLYRFAGSRLGGDPELIHDVVQTTVLKAIDNLDSYRGEAPLLTWMTGICRFEILAVYKARRRDGRPIELIEDAPEIRAALETLALTSEDPEQLARRREIERFVHTVLDHLPSRYGRALEWKYCEGLPVRTIAERLGVGEKAAESLLTRARGAFREAFATLSSGLPGERADGGVVL